MLYIGEEFGSAGGYRDNEADIVLSAFENDQSIICRECKGAWFLPLAIVKGVASLTPRTCMGLRPLWAVNTKAQGKRNLQHNKKCNAYGPARPEK